MSDVSSFSQAEWQLKAPVTQAPIARHVFVCTGKSCSSNASEETFQAFREQLSEKGLLYGKHGSPSGQVLLTTCGSMGLCAVGPAVMVYPEGIWYAGVMATDVAEIIEQHFIAQQPVQRLLARRLS